MINYNGLAVKAIKKSFSILKSNDSYSDFNWLLEVYNKAVNFYPDDEWLLRRKSFVAY